jgi:membrane-bound metal-dependent hydrolase YbcI (DUF457 family)
MTIHLSLLHSARLSTIMCMKGIAHFATGLCVASFVPGVAAGAAQGSLLIALGGVFGMLPDFLDFRFARFLQKRDAEIVPDAEDPNPQAIADAIARECALAMTAPRIIQLHPLRRSAIDWVIYSVRFDDKAGEVVVTMNGETARATVRNLRYGYDGALDIIELGGPSLKLLPSRLTGGVGGGPSTELHIEFLPWHRTWSHSLVLAAACGVAMGLLLGPAAGMVAAFAFAAHVLEDQLGYLGSNLFWPITKKRSDGMKLMHSGDTIPNMLTVWISLMLLLLNLDRVRDVPLIAPGPFLGFAVLLPAVVLIAVYARRRWHKFNAEVERNRDAIAENEAM